MLLTIYIPTYNRIYKLEKTIKNILQCESDEYEILIQDNGSTDGTLDIINGIDSKKIKIVTGIFGVYNNNLSFANGKYLITLLDKDIILGNRLADLIDFLKSNPNLSFGFCRNDIHIDEGIEKFKNRIVIYRGLQASLKYGFNLIHPSGRIVLTSEMRELARRGGTTITYCLDVTYNQNNSEVFYYDFPLIQIESRKESFNRQSTFFNGYNFWAYPDQYVNNEVKSYLQSISLKKKWCLNDRITAYKKSIDSFFSYLDSVREMLLDNDITLHHYNLDRDKIDVITRPEELFYYKRYILHYFESYIDEEYEVKESVLYYAKDRLFTPNKTVFDYYMDLIASFIANNKDRLQTEKIWIYGAGVGGEKVFHMLVDNNIEVEGFFDENAACINTKCGLPVCQMVSSNVDGIYIIVSLMEFNDQVYKLFKNLNIQKDRFAYQFFIYE